MKLKEFLMKEAQAPSVVNKAQSKEELIGMFRKMAKEIPGTRELWATISKEIESGVITNNQQLVNRVKELQK